MARYAALFSLRESDIIHIILVVSMPLVPFNNKLYGPDGIRDMWLSMLLQE